MDKQLRVIAVRPLNGCAKHILKVLKPDTTYFLYNNYEMCDDNQFIRNKGEIIPFDFFQLDADSPNISISAIVGKNGDGKSSLIELIIRILNNFSKIYGFGGDTDNLIYIKRINAEIYFSLMNNENEVIYKIRIESTETETITLLKEKNAVWSKQFSIQNNKPVTIKDIGDYTQADKNAFIANYFFTMVANYSLYAYNPYDYSEEWVWMKKEKYNRKLEEFQTCWLDSVFHKNDGYQTPIVLHPFREDGNIDVNTEQKLTTQRLLTLFLTDDTTENSFRWINDRQFAKDIKYTLIEESTLESKVFYDFFRSTFYYDSYQDQSAPPLYEINNEINNLIVKDDTNINLELSNKIQKEFVEPLRRMSEFVINNKEIFDRGIKIFDRVVEDLKKERDQSQNIDRDSDIQKYIIQVREVISKAKRIISDNLSNELNKADENVYHHVGKLNFNQFFQVVLVIFIQNEWKKKIPKLGNSIVRLNDIEKDLGYKAFDYLVYKTLSIIKKYPQYKHWYRFSYFQGYFLYNAEITSFEEEGYQKAIDEILLDKSHITLKLRQILNLLNYNFYTHKEHNPILYKNYINLFKLEVDQIEESIEGNKNYKQIRYRKCDFLDYYEAIQDFCFQKDSSIDNSKLIEFLPPAIFESEAVLLDKDKSESTLSKLSSGEKQLLSSTSSVLYHLRNINSVIPKYIDTVQTKQHIYQYKHINLFFEEIELYFHPEYQRRFIKYLLDRISRIDLSKISSINICMVTHSPFILSDIPSCNVLFLDKGISRLDMMNKNMNSFSSNIYDLLSEGFFLNAPMGEFAANIIERVVSDIKENKVRAQDRNQYDQIINLVGDVFLKTELKMMLYEKLGDEKSLEIIKLETRLKFLKGE